MTTVGAAIAGRRIAQQRYQRHVQQQRERQQNFWRPVAIEMHLSAYTSAEVHARHAEAEMLLEAERERQRHAQGLYNLLVSFPTQKFEVASAIQTECAICLSCFKDGDKLKALPCDANGRHAFHSSCLRRWFQQSDGATCPVCRFEFFDSGCSGLLPTQVVVEHAGPPADVSA